MKRILASALAAALLAPVAAQAGDFIAKRIADNRVIAFTKIPCENEPGHKVLASRGNTMGSGCYSIMQDGAALIRWTSSQNPLVLNLESHERIEANQIETIPGEFKGWPVVDWSKHEPLSPKGNRG